MNSPATRERDEPNGLQQGFPVGSAAPCACEGRIAGGRDNRLGHDKPTMTYGLYSGGNSLKVKQAAIQKLRYGRL